MKMMKKMIATMAAAATLTMSAYPALAANNQAGNIRIDGNKNNIKIEQTFVDNSKQIEFSDTKNHWAEQAIKNLVKKGVLKGVGQNKFDPEAKVTRAQFATMVSKYFHLTATDSSQHFVDVEPESWMFPFVEATRDYFDAYRTLDGQLAFHPEEGAKREDVTVTLVKVMMKLDPSLQLFTEEQAETLLKEKFEDWKEIAPALRPYVATAVQHKLIHGDNGRFHPNRTLSRAEAAALLERLGDNAIVVGGSSEEAPAQSSTTPNGTTEANSDPSAPAAGTVTP
jgi:hypothetical protein